ncbi:YARHG domain-containing protein [Anaerophaga thermohalophila]|uniref:YARHG domain-containing protein n=1 Tax=Anaerophaga thermohalophila TaxID=177400 RepID=UPI000A2F7E28|nr:YARHG domain-containing protein [Anaerophaga thermohalophila]
MKYITLICCMCLLLNINIFPQKSIDYNSVNYSFIGYYEDKPVYQFYPSDDNLSGGLKNKLYYPVLKENLTINNFDILNTIVNSSITYLNEDIKLYYASKVIEISYDGQTHLILKGERIRREVAYSKFDSIVTFPVKGGVASFLVLFNLSTKKLINIPLIGMRPSFNKDYLYFSSHHICDWYSVYTEDVYRVKIGDWNNPELVLENVDPGNWFLIPESNVIYADILEEQGKGVLYNADTRSYKIVDAIYGDRVIKYKGEYYYELKPNNKPISYRPVNLPSEYPQKDDRVLCPANKKRYFNLSNSQKPFTGTFINNELLYNAPEATLNKLDKEELRLLRNAFFARQGYQFKSDDLQEFFRQFEWYNELLKSYKVLEITNEDVVISPKDKERVELIMKIENRK